MAEVRLRQCVCCHLPGRLDTNPLASDYHLYRLQPRPAWRRDCVHCVRARVRARGDHRTNRIDLTRADRQHRWRTADPDRARAAWLAQKHALRADPSRATVERENDRMAYRLRREQAGRVLVMLEPAGRAHGARLDPEPLREWLQARKVAYGSWEALARACMQDGESMEDRERTLHRICEGSQAWVSEFQVDQILSREGSAMLHELYPELAAAA
jgi:hypothetical protein